MAPAARAARTIGALAAALTLAVLLAQAASASDQDMEFRADAAWQYCLNHGGVPFMTYNFNANGSLASIEVNCIGGAKEDNWNCIITPNGTESCDLPFTPDYPDGPQDVPGPTTNKPVWPEEDADGDGLGDAAEAEYGTDPRNRDTDGDALPDGDEVYVYFTDPTRWDTDGDGIDDGAEVFKGTDPTDPASS
jgi:hypothetical protein